MVPPAVPLEDDPLSKTVQASRGADGFRWMSSTSALSVSELMFRPGSGGCVGKHLS